MSQELPEESSEYWTENISKSKWETCPVCGGTGIVYGFLFQEEECDNCKGRGEVQVE